MKYLYTLLLLLPYLLLQAQDPRFAQFYAAPDQLNPALGVVYEGQLRFIAQYRDQWASVLNEAPFRTIAAHIDYRLNVGRNDYLSIGFSGLRDEAGSSNYTQSNGYLNLAYMKYLGGRSDKEYYLVAGAQVGEGQREINSGNLWFSQQFDLENLVVDASTPSGEAINPRSNIYPDFNAGMLWYTLTNNYAFYLGAAIFHINTPNISLYEGQREQLQERFVGHLGGEIGRNNALSLLPAAAVYLQGPAMDINIGANIRYASGEEEVALRIGGWVHLGRELEKNFSPESVTITTMLESNTWLLGLSYDINVSNLTAVSNARGAFEASFTYIIPEKQRQAKVNCPKF